MTFRLSQEHTKRCLKSCATETTAEVIRILCICSNDIWRARHKGTKGRGREAFTAFQLPPLHDQRLK